MKAWILLLLLVPAVIALESSRVYIVDMSYADGQLAVKDHLLKFGYAPDYRLQPESGFRIEVLSAEGEALYAFNFEIPTDEFTDIGEENATISGGLVRHSATDFSLVIPYFPDAKEIAFLDARGSQLGVLEAEQPEEKADYGFLIASVAVLIAAVLLIVFLSRRRKK